MGKCHACGKKTNIWGECRHCGASANHIYNKFKDMTWTQFNNLHKTDPDFVEQYQDQKKKDKKK